MKKNILSLKTGLAVTLLCSLIISIMMMSIALDHNPMGEFCGYPEERTAGTGCHIDWIHLFNLGVMWFLFSFLLIFFVILIIRSAYRTIFLK